MGMEGREGLGLGGIVRLVRGTGNQFGVWVCPLSDLEKTAKIQKT